MNLEDALSRLLTGDLPDGEARRWRERIATEPEVAAAWAAMQGLVQELETVPADRPPPELDAAVLAAPRGRWSRVVVGLAAAALVLALVGILARGPERPVVTLSPGVHVVEGRIRIVAGAVVVDVDGACRIAIEPSGEPVREPSPGGEDMKTVASAIAGAALGSLVTVAVIDGTAEVASGEAVVVQAGEALEIPSSTTQPARGTGDPSAASTHRGLTMAELRIDELEAEVAELSRDLAVANGQLATHRGTLQDWPSDVAPEYAPDAMQDRMDRVFGPLAEQGISAELDCAEYPCIIVARVSGEEFPPFMAQLTEGLDDPAVLMVQSSDMTPDEGPTRVQAFSLLGEPLSADAHQRTEYRLSTLADAEL